MSLVVDSPTNLAVAPLATFNTATTEALDRRPQTRTFAPRLDATPAFGSSAAPVEPDAALEALLTEAPISGELRPGAFANCPDECFLAATVRARMGLPHAGTPSTPGGKA